MEYEIKIVVKNGKVEAVYVSPELQKNVWVTVIDTDAADPAIAADAAQQAADCEEKLAAGDLALGW